jgi:hypothetical protein
VNKESRERRPLLRTILSRFSSWLNSLNVRLTGISLVQGPCPPRMENRKWLCHRGFFCCSDLMPNKWRGVHLPRCANRNSAARKRLKESKEELKFHQEARLCPGNQGGRSEIPRGLIARARGEGGEPSQAMAWSMSGETDSEGACWQSIGSRSR